MSTNGARPPDFVWIEPGFAVGSRPYAEERSTVAGAGVTVVLSLHDPQPEDEAAWAAVGIRFLAFPTRDWVAIPASQLTRVVDEIIALRARGEVLLLHCLAGVNRAPSVAAAVLCRTHNLSVGDAVKRVQVVRPTASPTPEQLQSLHAWVNLERKADG